jgi:hypothetical protein
MSALLALLSIGQLHLPRVSPSVCAFATSKEVRRSCCSNSSFDIHSSFAPGNHGQSAWSDVLQFRRLRGLRGTFFGKQPGRSGLWSIQQRPGFCNMALTLVWPGENTAVQQFSSASCDRNGSNWSIQFDCFVPLFNSPTVKRKAPVCSVTFAASDSKHGRDSGSGGTSDAGHRERSKSGRMFLRDLIASSARNGLLCPLVVAGMSTIPTRREALQRVVHSLLPQVDKLYINMDYGTDDALLPELQALLRSQSTRWYSVHSTAYTIHHTPYTILYSYTILNSHSTHTQLTLYSHFTHILLTLHSHSTHTLLTLYSHSTHTLLTLNSHSTHTLLTLYSHSTHTQLTLNSHSTHTINAPPEGTIASSSGVRRWSMKGGGRFGGGAPKRKGSEGRGVQQRGEQGGEQPPVSCTVPWLMWTGW